MNSHIVEKTVGSIKNVDRLTDLAAIEVYHTTHDALNKYEIMKEHATQKYTDEEFYQESVLAGVLIGAGIIGVAVSAFFIIKKIIDSKAKGSGESGGGAAKTTDLTSEQSIKKTAADFEKQINDAKIPSDRLVKLPFRLDAKQVKALMDIFTKSKEELVAITDSSSAEDVHKVIENLDANAINNADPAKIILREETQCKASDIVSRSEFELLVEFTKIYKDYYAECEKIEKKLQKAKKDNPDANIQVSPEDQKKLEQFTNAAAKRMNELTAAETKFIGEMEKFIQDCAKAALDEENAKKQQQEDNPDQDTKDKSKPEPLYYPKTDPRKIPDTAEAKANKKTLDDTINMLKSGKSEEDVRNALALNNYNNDQINAFLNEAKEIAGRKDKIIKALMAKGKSQTVATAIATDVCDKYNGDLAQYMNAKIVENQGNAWADNEAYKNCMIIADVIGFDKASITKPSQGTPEQQNGPENANPEGGSSQDNNGGEVYTKYEDIPEEKLKAIAAKIYPRSKYEDAKDRIKPYIRAALAGEDNIKDALDRNAGYFYHQTIAATNPMPMENALKGMTDMFNSYKGAAEELGKPFPFDLNFYLGQVDPSLRKQQHQVQNPPTNPPTPPTSEPEKKSEPQSENSGGPNKITYSSDNHIVINGEDTGWSRPWPDEPDENEKGEKVINYFISKGEIPKVAALNADLLYTFTKFELDGIKQYHAIHNDEASYKHCIDLCNALGFDVSQLSPPTPGDQTETTETSDEKKSTPQGRPTPLIQSNPPKGIQDDLNKLEELEKNQDPEALAAKLHIVDADNKPSSAILLTRIDEFREYITNGLDEDEIYTEIARDFIKFAASIGFMAANKRNVDLQFSQIKSIADAAGITLSEPDESTRNDIITRVEKEFDKDDTEETKTPTPSSFENYRDAQEKPEQQPNNPPSTNVAMKNRDNIIQQASFDGIPNDIVNNICDNAVNDINSNIPFDAASRIKDDAAKLATDQKLSFADAAKRILKAYENAAADMEPQTDAVKKYIEDIKQAAESDLSSLEPEASAEQLEDVNAYATKIFETINSIPGAGAKYAADIAKSRYNDNEKQMIVDDIVNRLKATGDANKIAQADEFIKAYDNAINPPASGNEGESKPSIPEDTGSGANSNNSETTTPSEGMVSTKPDSQAEYYGAGVEKSKQAINTGIKNALDKTGMSGTVNSLRISGDTIINTITQSISNMGEYASPEAVCRSVDEILNNSVYKTIHDDLIQYKRKGSIVNGIARVGNALHKNGFMSNFGEAITTLCGQIRDICAELLHAAYNVPMEIINRTIPRFESYRGSTEGVGLVYSQWFKEYELDLIRDKKIQMIMESQQQEEQKSE